MLSIIAILCAATITLMSATYSMYKGLETAVKYYSPFSYLCKNADDAQYNEMLKAVKKIGQDKVTSDGMPIPFKHGYPLRLIVPQWYAMASVKWLNRIIVIDYHFQGPFQRTDYNYYPYKDSDVGKNPVTKINVSSIIQKPLSNSILDTENHVIEGIAWTGAGVILEVEVSTDGGQSWHKAKLLQDQSQQYSWTFWNYVWKVPHKGEYIIMSRAKDSFGRIQPFKAMWNRKGYGYNAVYTIKIKVE